MYRIFVFSVVTGGCLLALSGCKKENRPEGLPVLYSCSVKVVHGDEPAEGVDVRLYDPAVSRQWSVSGTTDASGVAQLRTHGQFPGAPAGTFKVVLRKSENENTGPEGRETVKIFSLVEKQYRDESTTPLEISVGNKGVAQTFDIGEPVRVLIETVRPGGI